MEDSRENQVRKHPIRLDEKTDAALQKIADAPEDGLEKAVLALGLDIDVVTAFLKVRGYEDLPEAKAIVAALKKASGNGPAP
jgi:hypothetical protein